jgi:regulatory protein
VTEEEARDPVDLAVRALRHRDRSAAELDERLARAGIDDERRVEALERLARLGYVDDARLAADRARALAARGHGDRSIRADLRRRGIDAEATEAALATLEPESARADTLVERGGPTPRTARRLAAKGFSSESIESALGSHIAGGGADLV